MKTPFEYSIAFLSILTILLGITEIVLEISVDLQLKQQEQRVRDRGAFHDACEFGFNNLKCKLLQLPPFGYSVATGSNTLSVTTGVLSTIAGALALVYIVLRQTWIWGFLSLVGGSIAFLLGTTSLVYVFVKERAASHVSLSDFKVGPASITHIMSTLLKQYFLKRPDFKVTRESLLCHVRYYVTSKHNYRLWSNACSCAQAGRWMFVPILIALTALVISARVYFRRISDLGPGGEERQKEMITYEPNEEE